MKKVILMLLVIVLIGVLGGCTETTTASTTTTTSTTPTSSTTTGLVGINHPFSVEISNGNESIEPYLMFLCSFESQEGIGTFYADGVGMFDYDILDYADEFPTLNRTGSLSIMVNEYSEWSGLTVFLADGTLIGPRTLAELASLTSGSYFVRFHAGQTEGMYYKQYLCFVELVVE